MSFVAVSVAGIAVAAGGSIASAAGAARNASAVRSATGQAIQNENDFFTRQNQNLDTLINDKQDRLYDLGNIFDRFESTGAFGDTATLRNLRQAQNDFSALAAGDFSGFEAQLRQTIGDQLVNTVGSGAPVGTFAGLAADAQMGYRQQGLQTAVGLSEFFSNQANQLLGAEFGIMDQRFNTEYQIDRSNVDNVNNLSLRRAQQAGVGLTAYGNAAQSVGGMISSFGTGMYGMGQANLTQQVLNAPRAQDLNGNPIPYGNQAPQPSTYIPQSYTPMPSLPSSYNSGGYNFPSQTIYPSSPAYNYVDQPSPFSYGTGYSPGSMIRQQPSQDVELLLPPMANNSSFNALGSVGRNIVAS